LPQIFLPSVVVRHLSGPNLSVFSHVNPTATKDRKILGQKNGGAIFFARRDANKNLQ
jgi:hypothetical protein